MQRGSFCINIRKFLYNYAKQALLFCKSYEFEFQKLSFQSRKA